MQENPKVKPKNNPKFDPYNPEYLRRFLDYNPLTGALATKKGRRVFQDTSGLCTFFDSELSRNVKLKVERICYSMAFGKAPRKDRKVLHRNMQPEDNRLANLVEVSRLTYLSVKEAYDNLSHGIRIMQHPEDKFCSIVIWSEQGQQKKKLAYDSVVADKIKVKLQLKFSKILTKYCIFE